LASPPSSTCAAGVTVANCSLRSVVALAKVCEGKSLISFAVGAPFGTIKAWMGATHFQMRTLPKVATEMALHVLAYNMKRVMRILGTGELMAAMRA
jgi:pyrroline-5-carboxylate reductase